MRRGPRLRGPVAARIVRGRRTYDRSADRVRVAVHRGARQRDPPADGGAPQRPGSVRQGRAHDALGGGDERRPRPGRSLRATRGHRCPTGLDADRRVGRGHRVAHPREPGAGDPVAAGRARRARPEGGRAPGDRQGARPAPTRERDPARIGGAPARRVRVGGRRHRGARRERRDRPRERRLLPDDRAPPVPRRGPAVGRALRLDPGRRALRVAPGDGSGNAPARGARDLPGVADLRGPRRPAASVAARPRRDRGPRRRPDDPVAVQVPPGP